LNPFDLFGKGLSVSGGTYFLTGRSIALFRILSSQKCITLIAWAGSV
jgi:hypothetical protein